MFRRLLVLLLLLMLPALSLADELVPYQLYTFAGQLPDELKLPLSNLVPDESRVLSGAAIQYHTYNAAQADANNRACYSALVLVDGADGFHLYAAAQPEGLPWQVNDYTRFLRSSRNVSVSVYMPEHNRVPRFSIDYGGHGSLESDLFVFWNRQLWCMDGHINNGQNTAIGNEMGMIAVNDAAGRELFRCSNPFFLDYMSDLSAFPCNRSEAQALAWLPLYDPYTTGTILYCEGANLRLEHTGKSESLGQYARNTPMFFTGEQKQGASYPWYQVRIGSTLGWMSGNYVDDAPDWSYEPIRLGRTVDPCPLYATVNDKTPALELSPGTTFHILTEIGGMYHICIPQGDISWAADAQGTYGYIPTSGVLTGCSPSALHALEFPR